MKKNEKEETKVVVKKVKIVNILIVLLLLYIIGFYAYKVVVSPINNIFVVGNKYLTDQEIIDIAGIRNYPSFILTTKYNIKKKLLKNDLIDEVKIKKSFGRMLTIELKESDPLFIYNDKVILSNGKQIDNKDYKLPTITNYVEEDILNKLIEKYQNVDDEIKIMISEIEYVPNDIDKERFIITMNDGNYVYITLYKITSINEYIKIVSTLDNKKGILYLDSGNYFETFKD